MREYGCVAALLLLVTFIPLAHETLTVPDDYPAIQEAIDAASSGDTVFVRAGTYTENLTITKPLRLVGEGRLKVRIRNADSEDPVVRVRLDEGALQIEGLSVSDANSRPPDQR